MKFTRFRRPGAASAPLVTARQFLARLRSMEVPSAATAGRAVPTETVGPLRVSEAAGGVQFLCARGRLESRGSR
jgi:hypothetical protein